jgi:ABC-type nitrate/sulfonate/bicarbonate transport system substrate-binding protein
MSQTSVIESPIHALAPEATELTFGIHAEGPTTLALAKSLGLIHDEFAADPDLNFSIDRFRSGSEEWPSEEDFRLVEVDHASALWERSRGLDSHLVGLSWMEGTYPVVALTGSGIRWVTELKGKRLGIIKASGSPFDAGYAQQLKIYTTVLSTAKLTLADVELVPIERPPFHPGHGTGKATAELNIDLAARLHRGEFDAITVALASDLAHQVSIRILSDTQDHYDFIARVHPGVLRAVVVSGALLRQRRSLVVRALARLLEAADWAKRRTAEQVAARFAEAGEGNAEALVAKYDGLAQGFHIDFSAEKILGLRAQKNFLLRHQLIEKNFDLDRWIDQGPFAEAYQLYAERGQTSGRTAGKA